MNIVSRYLHWLHLRWPAGTVEPLPRCDRDGRTSVPGVRIVGDLTGVPLLKLALDSGATAASQLADELAGGVARNMDDRLDVVVIGGGVSGMATAIECVERGLRCLVVETAQPFATIANFPARKRIFTYPSGLTPRGALQVKAGDKEGLLDELRAQLASHVVPVQRSTAERITRDRDGLVVHLRDEPPLHTRRVVVAIGRTGNFRRLGVPGEDLPHVTNRLIDPAPFSGQAVAVIGGGDSAIEAALALSEEGAHVTLIHRGASFPRAKPESVRALEHATKIMRLPVAAEVAALARPPGQLTLRHSAEVARIAPTAVLLADGSEVAANQVFVLVGREPPLEFLRRSGIRLRGERSRLALVATLAFAAAITMLYAMKGFGVLGDASWNPARLARVAHADMVASDAHRGLWYTLVASASNGIGFYITLLYSTAVVAFGIDRMRRRRTPYVRAQTLTLIAVQCSLLFVVPEILLPWLGHQGAFDHGPLKDVADALFPLVDYDANGREYWRAYGLILAWPLFVWNVFTAEPLTGWLVISLLQTFVIIPLIVRRWGKGAYCGWLCSCGALAETMGDRHRDKMPHGVRWNRVNIVGQVLLLVAGLMLILQVFRWIVGASWAVGLSDGLLVHGWKPIVDFAIAGALGTGLYFAYSGRVWCRFACPLAALMNIYARFSRFRILADGKKCISCNACTTTCHQGIDVMHSASRGEPMADPQCVRCSACVEVCPTGVLSFGQVDRTGAVISVDRLIANTTRAAEQRGANPQRPS
jgi:NosR/NirI family nitrous oxide reductase transcriptional regulator